MSFLRKVQARYQSTAKVESATKIEASTSTPWGISQDATKIAPGLTWYSCAGHGGLCVSMGMAQKKLSAKARGQGIKYAGAYWYEEDCAWAIPLYENLDWIPLFNKNGFTFDENNIKSTVQRWFPQYIEGPEPTEVTPFNKLQVGDLIYIDRPDSEPYRVGQIEPNKLRIERGGQTFRFGKSAYFSRVKKVERAKVVQAASDQPKADQIAEKTK